MVEWLYSGLQIHVRGFDSRLALQNQGDMLQGVTGDCKSSAETHARFDSWIAHHSVEVAELVTHRIANPYYAGSSPVFHSKIG